MVLRSDGPSMELPSSVTSLKYITHNIIDMWLHSKYAQSYKHTCMLWVDMCTHGQAYVLKTVFKTDGSFDLDIWAKVILCITNGFYCFSFEHSVLLSRWWPTYCDTYACFPRRTLVGYASVTARNRLKIYITTCLCCAVHFVYCLAR